MKKTKNIKINKILGILKNSLLIVCVKDCLIDDDNNKIGYTGVIFNFYSKEEVKQMNTLTFATMLLKFDYPNIKILHEDWGSIKHGARQFCEDAKKDKLDFIEQNRIYYDSFKKSLFSLCKKIKVSLIVNQ